MPASIDMVLTDNKTWAVLGYRCMQALHKAVGLIRSTLHQSWQACTAQQSNAQQEVTIERLKHPDKLEKGETLPRQ